MTLLSVKQDNHIAVLPVKNSCHVDPLESNHKRMTVHIAQLAPIGGMLPFTMHYVSPLTRQTSLVKGNVTK